MKRAYERLLEYVKIYTTSDENSGTTPSAGREFDLARILVEEMTAIGIRDAHVDDLCYVYGTIPASPGYEKAPAVGFLAHLDTAPDFCGEQVRPQIHEQYDGGEIRLGQSGRILSPEMFPDLKERIGQTLITTDGTTLLGADDKAGIAEIMTAAERILSADREGSGRPHGKICIAFTPDEEIGSGAADLDLEKFGARYAYTVDGDREEQIVYETFNACEAKFEIHGVNIHPGDAKNRMVNAGLIAARIVSMLPPYETPSCTEKYEGFYHVTSIEGTVEKAAVSMIVRDHSSALFEARMQTLRHMEKMLNEAYGEGTVRLTIRQQYRNMAEKLQDCMHLIENVKEIIRGMGKEPDVSPVRGGTDGAQLTFRGLPCPNLGTGGSAFHGPYEHISAEAMDFVVGVIMRIVEKYADAQDGHDRTD